MTFQVWMSGALRSQKHREYLFKIEPNNSEIACILWLTDDFGSYKTLLKKKPKKSWKLIASRNTAPQFLRQFAQSSTSPRQPKGHNCTNFVLSHAFICWRCDNSQASDKSAIFRNLIEQKSRVRRSESAAEANLFQEGSTSHLSRERKEIEGMVQRIFRSFFFLCVKQSANSMIIISLVCYPPPPSTFQPCHIPWANPDHKLKSVVIFQYGLKTGHPLISVGFCVCDWHFGLISQQIGCCNAPKQRQSVESRCIYAR